MEKRIIKVKGTSLLQFKPDWVIINFSIKGSDAKYSKCATILNQKIEILKNELSAEENTDENLKTVDYIVKPAYEYIKNKYQFNGYTASAKIRLELKYNNEKLANILSIISQTKSEAEYRVNFDIKDKEKARRVALEEAVNNAKYNAQILANASQVKLGDVTHIEYGWDELRIRTMRMEETSFEKSMSAPQPTYELNPREISVGESVTIYWEIL